MSRSARTEISAWKVAILTEVLHGFSLSPEKCYDNTLNWATTSSFRVLYLLLFIDNLTVRSLSY